MTRKCPHCPAVVRTWSSFDWKGMDNWTLDMHGRTQSCLTNDHSGPFRCLSIEQWRHCSESHLWIVPSGINTESLRISWQRCIFRVLVISKQLCHFFLAYCKMCYILLIFLSNVLYNVVEYLDLLSEALFNEILYDCPTIFTNISVDKSSNRNRILYFFLCSHSWPHTTADLLIEKNVMKEVNSDL